MCPAGPPHFAWGAFARLFNLSCWTVCCGSPVGRDQLLKSGHDSISNGGSFDCGTYVMGAEDVGSAQDGGYVCDCCGVEAIFHGRCRSIEKDGHAGIFGECMGEEAFAGDAHEKRQIELLEFGEVREERVVFVEALAESEAWVEDDLVARDASCCGGFEAFG